MSDKKNILLTGASGAVGREILSMLASRHHEFNITVFDRKTKISEKIFSKYKKKVRIIYGNIVKEAELDDTVKNSDYVFHIAAVIPPLADEFPDLAYNVNVTGTKNLIESMKKNSPDAFLFYSSSISVYGDRIKNQWIKTTDDLIPSARDEYAKTKILAEEIIQNSGLNWTIFRLTAIMGYKNHKISKLMFHMPLNTPMEISTPQDTARAFVNAIDHTENLNKRIFNLGGGERCRISFHDFLTRSFDIMGLGKFDFPEQAFADKNFHCGYYADSDELDNIIKYRKDSIDDYFRNLKRYVNPVIKFLSFIFRNIIKKSILKKSEPMVAVKTNNKNEINHYKNYQ